MCVGVWLFTQQGQLNLGWGQALTVTGTREGVLEQALNSRRGLWDYKCVSSTGGLGVGREGIKARVEGGNWQALNTCPHLCAVCSLSLYVCLSKPIITSPHPFLNISPSSFLLLSAPRFLPLPILILLFVSNCVPYSLSSTLFLSFPPYFSPFVFFGSLEGQQCQTRGLEDWRHSFRTTGGLLVVRLSILVAAGRRKEGLAMVTAMEDASPNGVREEEATPPGQPGVEGPAAARSAQGADSSGGEERRRRCRGV